MAAQLTFTSIHDAALRLNEVARDQHCELHPLPYRRFDPEADSTWWLAPTTDNPAYGQGKVVIEPGPDRADKSALIGLHVEKGVGPGAASVFEEMPRGKRLLMRDDWVWHAFSKAMRTGDLDRSMAAAVQAAGELPLTLLLISAVQDLPAMESVEDRDRFAAELIWYRAKEGQLELAKTERPDALARALEGAETLADLAEKTRTVKDIDWRWVEVLIGIQFERVPSGGLSAAEVWRRACAPWLDWVRRTKVPDQSASDDG